MNEWTSEQLAAAVDGYRALQDAEAQGQKPNKTELYRQLATAYGRTPKAWEYRMQNISHVLEQLGLPWVQGLRPAKNVGAAVTGQLVKLLGGSVPTAVSGPALTDLKRERDRAEEGGAFSPDSVEDQRKRVYASIVRRQGQAKFRSALLEAYDGRCAMTGWGVVDVLEAAHIYPYLGKDTNVVPNGLLLRADVHTLFDLQLISVDAKTMEICVAPELRETGYGVRHGAPLGLPDIAALGPDRRLLKRHRALCAW